MYFYNHNTDFYFNITCSSISTEIQIIAKQDKHKVYSEDLVVNYTEYSKIILKKVFKGKQQENGNTGDVEEGGHNCLERREPIN